MNKMKALKEVMPYGKQWESCYHQIYVYILKPFDEVAFWTLETEGLFE